MGNVHAYRGRLTPALIALALLALAIVVFGMVAGPASARPTFEPVCAGCHSMSAIHAGTTHSATVCTTCHVSGTATPPPPSACATCHGPVSAILGSTAHTANACGTTPGCHGVPPAVVTTTITAAKVAPTTVTLGKKVKASGIAGPAASLAGAKVAFKVERKVGTKWVKMKTGTATASATGAFAWSYKAVKKGAHRVTMSIAATSTFTAKKVVKTFKVR